MSKAQDDHAYRVLLKASEDSEVDMSPSLLLDLYVIQKEHQFDKDPAASMERMQARILDEIDLKSIPQLVGE